MKIYSLAAENACLKMKPSQICVVEYNELKIIWCGRSLNRSLRDRTTDRITK